ncbi:hemerythrin family protein [Rhodoblastus sp.]|jgi:hemerythrin-like metal-binding protein|uniref:bacteriohemerythrin n=1 Tax=Rhodoblastus sp. TaxID=1962975 RepID=UPI0025EFC2FB|nr:hemerythrin family protein [Rhodoblastus sp.]
MNLPKLPLGVPLMDRDHAVLEQMFSTLPETKDANLLPLFEAIAQEICDHFSREEIMMEQAQVPILSCHKAQHAALLREVETMRAYLATAEAKVQRHQIGFVLTHLVANHVGGVDQVTSTFLTNRSSAGAPESDSASQPACMAS